MWESRQRHALDKSNRDVLARQAYVALSRATTLDGLHLKDFHVGVVKAHESVKKFYASLEVGATDVRLRLRSIDHGLTVVCRYSMCVCRFGAIRVSCRCGRMRGLDSRGRCFVVGFGSGICIWVAIPYVAWSFLSGWVSIAVASDLTWKTTF